MFVLSRAFFNGSREQSPVHCS